MQFDDFLDAIDGVIWGPYLLIPLLLGTGVILTFRLKGVQLRSLIPALKLGLLKRKDDSGEGDISQYQALTTALAATVGTGNIIGVATAISFGGPGAVFWMWVTGLFGMASKYAEAFLGSKYREVDEKGEQSGGPQVFLKRAIGGPLGKILATCFAIFGAFAAFGIGNMTQANSISVQLANATDGAVQGWMVGIVIMITTGLVLLGGITRIGKMTAGLVPLMIVLYIGGGIIVLVANAQNLLPAFQAIFVSAFTGSAALGGFAGAGVALAMRYGMARGIFSNESGMGSASIVAAAAQTSHPVRQGLVSMTQTFIDTMIVVSFTALVILSSGGWYNEAKDDGSLNPGIFTQEAFQSTFLGGIGTWIVVISLVFFAYSTIIGWSYYGERCLVSLLGIKAQIPYRLLFTLVTFAGCVIELTTVWTIADILNGLMAIPNLIGLLALSGLVAHETAAYLKKDPTLELDNVEPLPLRQWTPGQGWKEIE